ncbi:MAG: S41 family peptidase [Saprospiraceae bacterium]|nr:S41 family peptidase [Saprospiraceae bacterium]
MPNAKTLTVNFKPTFDQNMTLKKTIFSLFLLVLKLDLGAQLTGNLDANVNSYTNDEKRDIILKTKQLVADNYVIIDKINSIDQKLDEFINSKTFDTTSTKLSFRRALAYQLRSASNDLHFSVFPVSNFENNTGSSTIDTTYGIVDAKYIIDSIGYFKFNYFPPLNDTTKKAFDSAFKKLRRAKTIIIDLTDNYGGNPYFEAYLCSYFFQDSTHLYDIYSRKDDSTYQFWTYNILSDSRFNSKTNVFVLTSERTFSAGEAFAYDLQTKKRAKVVGQQTPGGANPGASFFINDKLKVFIPVSKTINFTTKSNWEGIGVTPDIITKKQKEIDAVIKELKRRKKSSR